MNFRKKIPSPQFPRFGGSDVLITQETVTRDYSDGSKDVKVVEVHKYTQDDLILNSDIPVPDDYSLAVMLKSGYKPTEVNIKHLLDSRDPLEQSNLDLVNSVSSQIATDSVSPSNNEE